MTTIKDLKRELARPGRVYVDLGKHCPVLIRANKRHVKQMADYLNDDRLPVVYRIYRSGDGDRWVIIESMGQ